MEGTGVAAEEQSIIVVHPTTKKPIELPLQLSDVSQQLYTELVEALINLMSNEERLQKAHAMTELGNEMHRLQTENRELRMKVKRLENALVGLEQFSGTLQRKLTHQQQSGSGPLIGMSGVLTLGTESQLQVIKDLTRENVQLKQAVAGIDKGQPQAVETIMVINELQGLNTVLRLEKAKLCEELAEIRNLNDNVGNPEQEAILMPYLDRVNQLELRLEAKESLIESLSNELEKANQVMEEERLKWNRKEQMLNRTVGNLRRMVDNMRQQMVAHTQLFSVAITNTGIVESQQAHISRQQHNVALSAASVSVQTEINMDELGRFEDEICQLEVEDTARTAETTQETGGQGVDNSLDMQVTVSARDILLTPHVLLDSSCSSITEDSSVRDKDVSRNSSSRIDSGVSQLEQEIVRSQSKETVQSGDSIQAGEAEEKQTLEERLLQLKDEVSSIRLEKETCEVQLLQLNEIKDSLEQQNRCMVEDHNREIALIRTERERLQVNARGGMSMAVSDDCEEEMRKELEVEHREKQALQLKVDELTKQVHHLNMSAQEIETLRRDLEFEKQAHQTTKEQLVMSKEMTRNEMQKLRHQVEIDRARLTQLTAAKKSTDIHNQELQVELDQLAEQQRQLQSENRERMEQVQHLQRQVINKDDEIQRHQRLVEEARRQIREMKQERHLPSLGYGAEKVSDARHSPPDLLLDSLQSQVRIKSGDQPHAIAQQPTQSTATATRDYSWSTFEQQPQGSHQYDPAASSVLVRSEYTPLQEWMKKERVTSTVRGRMMHSSQQPSNSPVRPVSYSSQPSFLTSSPFPYPASDASRTVPVQTHQSVPGQWQQPSKPLTDKVLECPRCQKSFSASDFSQYREHLEQCLT